jgi:hypothetical protein
MGSCSCLLQGGGLEVLLIEEEAGGLDMAMGSSGLCLSILDFLNNVLKLSMEDSSIGVIQHGDHIGQKWLGLAEAEKNSGFDYHVSGVGLSQN